MPTCTRQAVLYQLGRTRPAGTLCTLSHSLREDIGGEIRAHFHLCMYVTMGNSADWSVMWGKREPTKGSKNTVPLKPAAQQPTTTVVG